MSLYDNFEFIKCFGQSRYYIGVIQFKNGLWSGDTSGHAIKLHAIHCCEYHLVFFDCLARSTRFRPLHRFGKLTDYFRRAMTIAITVERIAHFVRRMHHFSRQNNGITWHHEI